MKSSSQGTRVRKGKTMLIAIPISKAPSYREEPGGVGPSRVNPGDGDHRLGRPCAAADPRAHGFSGLEMRFQPDRRLVS